MKGITGSTCKTLTSETYFHVGVQKQRLIKAVDFGPRRLPREDRALI